MKVLGIIPARFAAQRFPGKPLADIAGKTLVQRVWERASRIPSLSGVMVATEDSRIADHVASFGGTAVMTSPDHASGTDRLGEIAAREDFDYFVNIQGDEPLLDIVAVDSLVKHTCSVLAPMSTIVTPFPADAGPELLDDPNLVKVVRDAEGFALYFSRSRIPYPRNGEFARYFKHVGIYMFSRETLLKICSTPVTDLERAEGLEQLRALYSGIRILTVEASFNSIEVNVPEDVDRVIARLTAEGQN